MIKYLLITIGILLITLSITLSLFINEVKEVERVKRNFKTLQQSNDKYVGELLITQSEMKQFYEKELKLFKDSLNLKPKHIDRWREVKAKSKVDTLIEVVYDTVYQLPILEFNDSCLVINAFPIDSVRYKLNVENNQHSYTTYFRQRPKKFLFIKYGRWEYLSTTLYLCPKEVVVEKQIDIKIKR
jgi:hypothetical protein